jgi:hypothetical protein
MDISMNAQRFPLSWPSSWKRTPFHQRRRAAFHSHKTVYSSNVQPNGDRTSWRQKETLSVGVGLERLTGELGRLGAQRVIISSNLRVRSSDGLPYAQQAKNLDDPGVAVYFMLKGAPRVLACDRWLSAAENMAAIAGHIHAIRAQDRYGVGTLEQAFAGYAALPPTSEDWPIVLGIPATSSKDAIIAAHRKLATEHHPDKGGRLEDMARINAARDTALKAVLV